jgi:VIT1/CCC1 family predicted Fe2+/Mn2+ transporter
MVGEARRPSSGRRATRAGALHPGYGEPMGTERRLEDLSLEEVIKVAHRSHRHRSVSTGGARAAVFGASDGLVSNVALILGVAAAEPVEGIVRLAGLSGLVAGAVSMAVGEYVSMRSQAELYERELTVEREAQRKNPELEELELAKIYESRGVEPDVAAELAAAMMADPEIALEVHAREELGFDPDQLGSPIAAAASSFVAFSLGALLPLVPWLFTGGTRAIVASVVLGVVGALGLGITVGVLSMRSPIYAGLRQLGLAAVATAATMAIGSLVGASS